MDAKGGSQAVAGDHQGDVRGPFESDDEAAAEEGAERCQAALPLGSRVAWSDALGLELFQLPMHIFGRFAASRGLSLPSSPAFQAVASS